MYRQVSRSRPAKPATRATTTHSPVTPSTQLVNSSRNAQPSLLALSERQSSSTRRLVVVTRFTRSYAAKPAKGGAGDKGKEEKKEPKAKRPNVSTTDITETGLFGSTVYTEIKKKDFKTKEAIGDQYWSQVQADESRRAPRPTDLLSKRASASEAKPQEDEEGGKGDDEVSTNTRGVTGGAKHWQLDEDEFEELGDMLNNALRARNAYANDPIFSPKAKAKAWELHKSNPSMCLLVN